MFKTNDVVPVFKKQKILRDKYSFCCYCYMMSNTRMLVSYRLYDDMKLLTYTTSSISINEYTRDVVEEEYERIERVILEEIDKEGNIKHQIEFEEKQIERFY